jgi:predicted dehydrogenase
MDQSGTAAPRSLRAGVIGAGVFGGHHARKYARTPGVVLTAIYDPDRLRAEALAADMGAEATVFLDALLDSVDVVTVASPAVTHAAMAKAALARGKPVYVEKPLATTLQDGDALVALAARQGVVLACGHQERAVMAALGLDRVPERPLRVEAVRRGTPSGRNEDVSAVLDLMIHDLDLALWLSGAEPIAVEAEGDGDALTADVTFADGLGAVFDCARNADARERRMTLIYPSGEIAIDLLARTLRNTTPFALDLAFADSRAGRDPLSASVDAFLAAVRGEAPRPLATGEEALAALDLALAVEQAAGF